MSITIPLIDSSKYLVEATRSELVRNTKSNSPLRYSKRLKYSPKSYQGVNLEDLFIYNRLTFSTPVGDYLCTISIDNIFDYLKKYVGVNPKNVRNKRNKINLDLQLIIKALSEAYDKSDVKIDCTCPDFVYRYSYYASKKGYKYGAQQTVPPKVTNPKDSIGSQCKHLTALLSNKRWIVKVASVINKYLTAHPERANKYLLVGLPGSTEDEEDE